MYGQRNAMIEQGINTKEYIHVMILRKSIGRCSGSMQFSKSKAVDLVA